MSAEDYTRGPLFADTEPRGGFDAEAIRRAIAQSEGR